MAQCFDSPIISRSGSNYGLRPAFSDPEFWSDVLVGKRWQSQYRYRIGLIDDAANAFVDDSGNRLVAATNYFLATVVDDGGDSMVDDSGNKLTSLNYK